MKKQTKIAITIVGSVLAVVLLSFLIFAVALTPKRDKIKAESFPDSYFVSNFSYVDYQENNECSAYAAAYVLRCFGENVSGKQLYPSMRRSFGMMTARSVVAVIESQGYSATAYHGSVDTLKQRLTKGYPIICFIKNGKDTHYVAVVGYDTEYVYLADSIKENANVSNSDLYNRKVKIKDFEKLWKNNFYAVNNVYIVVEQTQIKGNAILALPFQLLYC